VLAPVTIDRLYAGASDWGLLMGCFGLGGLIGGVLALRWHPDRPLIAVFTVLLAAPGALVLLGTTPPFAILAAGVVVFAIGTALTNTLWHTTVQQQVPPASLSRVSSYDWMVSLLIFPIGSALAGPMGYRPRCAIVDCRGRIDRGLTVWTRGARLEWPRPRCRSHTENGGPYP